MTIQKICFNEILRRLASRETLSYSESKAAVAEILAGRVSEIETASFLTALAVRGETSDELTGAVDAVRRETARVELPGIEAIDLVGTGGDALSTFNVSTAAAFVVAGAGLPVAKHGNRSVSSRCGSADVLESLGVRLDFTPEQIEGAIRETGIGFMFAPLFHRGMERVGNVRKTLGVRTLFNMIGPLVNPAETPFLLVGVYAPRLTELFADVLRRRGVRRAMVVCGLDGMDELTVTGESRMTLLTDGGMTTSNFYPELYFEEGTDELAALTGGGAKENAAILTALLEGRLEGAKKRIVLLNAGAALFVGQKAETLQEGIDLARASLESGKALGKLRALVEFCRDAEPLAAC